MAKIPPGVGPRFPQVVVLFGATGDLARRKLLPGLYHLASAGFIPQCRVIGVSLDDIDLPAFRQIARGALDQFFARKVADADWDAFAANLDYVPLAAGPQALAAAVAAAEAGIGTECRRLHYLSVPPSSALPAVRLLGEAGLVERARIVMEKPFGTDLASARHLNRELHTVFSEDQIFRIDHFLGKEPAQNILAFRFANGLFEPIWNRMFIDHVQIDVPETLGLGQRSAFYEQTGAYRDMVVTHLFQILAFMAMEPPKSMFPPGSGVGAQGPDHLTFDLADASKMSLSFYGKRPGPGMRLDKLSLQFAMHDTGMLGEVLEAYERLILDAMRGDHTLFNTAEGIERLWEVSQPLLESPPPVRLYAPGSWGPKSIHQLIAPHAWRLPFERAWRDPNTTGG